MQIPLEPPIFSKRGRAANAARCKRDALTGYEGASPSASTMHPTRRKRRTALVMQRAGRTSLWMLHFFMRTWWNSRHVGPRSRRAKAHEGAIDSLRIPKLGLLARTCWCATPRVLPRCALRAWTEREARRWRSPDRSEWVSRAGALWAARRTTEDPAVLKTAAPPGA